MTAGWQAQRHHNGQVRDRTGLLCAAGSGCKSGYWGSALPQLRLSLCVCLLSLLQLYNCTAVLPTAPVIPSLLPHSLGR